MATVSLCLLAMTSYARCSFLHELARSLAWIFWPQLHKTELRTYIFCRHCRWAFACKGWRGAISQQFTGSCYEELKMIEAPSSWQQEERFSMLYIQWIPLLMNSVTTKFLNFWIFISLKPIFLNKDITKKGDKILFFLGPLNFATVALSLPLISLG